MTEILLIRKLGRRKAGEVLDVELDGYWESHVAAGNVKLLEDIEPHEVEDVNYDLPVLADEPEEVDELEEAEDDEPLHFNGYWDDEVDPED